MPDIDKAYTELREAIEEILRPDRTDYFIKQTTDQIMQLFQAREQQLLTELLGELPKRPTINTKQPMVGSYANGIKVGKQRVLDQVVEILTSKIGELNG